VLRAPLWKCGTRRCSTPIHRRGSVGVVGSARAPRAVSGALAGNVERPTDIHRQHAHGEGVIVRRSVFPARAPKTARGARALPPTRVVCLQNPCKVQRAGQTTSTPGGIAHREGLAGWSDWRRAFSSASRFWMSFGCLEKDSKTSPTTRSARAPSCCRMIGSASGLSTERFGS
jgi:hypothetical protein